MTARRWLPLVVLLGLAAACGDADALREQERVSELVLDEPPTLTLLTPQGGEELAAWTYCLMHEVSDSSVGGCADGVPPRSPPRLEGVNTAVFTFPQDDWAFTAEFRLAAKNQAPACRRHQVTPVTSRDGQFIVPALGPAGVWDVDVSGRSMTDVGDSLVTTFRWVTRADSDLPVPAWGQVDFLAPPLEGLQRSAFGPTVRVMGLSPEPVRTAGTFTVTADTGESESFKLEPDKDDCAADGLVTFGFGSPGNERDVEGDEPFTYRMDLVLDEMTYVGTATWPDNIESPGSSSVIITNWEPPLPESALSR